MQKRLKFGVIGCGNMGSAIVESLIRKKIFKPQEIGISEPDAQKRSSLKKKLGVSLFQDNKKLTSSCSTLLLAVKPQQMKEVLLEIFPQITSRHLFLSIAAGLDTHFFQKHLPPKTRLIRVMPNMGVMVGWGASGLFAHKSAKAEDKKLALKIFSAGGLALFVSQEELLDSVTALSGSGPAFVFFFLKSLIEAGIQIGLSPKMSGELACQTIKGSLEIVDSSQKEISTEELSTLIQKIASKGGTTEAGLKVLEEDGFSDIVSKTLQAARQRAKELRCIS